MKLLPTSVTERIQSLDILRGLSLLGIILVNAFAFNTPQPHIYLHDFLENAEDRQWQRLLDIFVQGNIYPLFAMLFGYGLTMQYNKATALGERFMKTGTRRLTILFMIGLLHAFFLWWGDILMQYAFCGIVLLFLLRFPAKWLFIFTLPLYLVPNLVSTALMYLLRKLDPASVGLSTFVDYDKVEKAITAYGSGSWVDAFMHRVTVDLPIQFSVLMWGSSLVTILPYMLIGTVAAKWLLIERAAEKKKLWSILALCGLVVGFTLKSLPYWTTYDAASVTVQTSFGGPILAIGYASTIVLLCQVAKMRTIFKPFAAVGRMSLTVYILQSILLSIVFYNWGFGLYGEVSVATQTFIALGIYIILAVVSMLWLSKFNQGPIEKIWKKITYKK